MRATFRPIDSWPGEKTAPSSRKSRWTFRGKYEDTLQLLDRELAAIGATEFVIQVEMTDRDIRLDGMPRANASPSGPAVMVSFESKHGPLRYATDTFETWHANLRAIALALEALRKVDRYGISKRGEQYRGYTQLGSGMPMPVATMSVENAAAFLVEHSGEPCDVGDLYWSAGVLHQASIDNIYRYAAKRLHPDVGGSTELFQQLQEAKSVLDRAATR